MDCRTGFLGIDDPDEPIYRIFPLWFFEETLRVGNLVLVPPERWEDPFEVLPSRVIMERPKPYEQKPLETFLKPAYAQCWSRTKESDTLLRAYSRVVKDPHHRRNTLPREEGVVVRSTPRKLLSAMQDWARSRPAMSCFIGAVRYESSDAIRQYLTDRISQYGPGAVGRGQLRAELLLLKRQMFSHEAEVRMICVCDLPEQPLMQIPVDPSSIFDEVTFDPRLETFEQREREAVARSLNYKGPVRRSDWYTVILLQVILPNGWKED